MQWPRRDEESPYLSAKAPASGGPPTLGQRVAKELKQHWWLWAAVLFTMVLVSGLFLFRNKLYDTATHGLPFLAGVSMYARAPVLMRNQAFTGVRMTDAARA